MDTTDDGLDPVVPDPIGQLAGLERTRRIVADRQARRRARLRAEGLPTRTDAEKAGKARYRQSDAGKIARKRETRRVFDATPFMGVDGEGCGEDEHGRQHYMLLRIGPRELFTGKPLTTRECLNFILDTPPDAIMVGFSFGYDTTQILRDLPYDRWGQLFKPRVYGPGHSPYTWFGSDIGIDYLPRNFLRVCRFRRISDTKLEQVPGSVRTIYETFGFFQMSFVNALSAFDQGAPDQLAMIARNKGVRGIITEIDQETRDYCALECQLLAGMMETLRTLCIENDIFPREWSGAGKISDYLHQRYGTITAKELEELEDAGRIPKDVTDHARRSYYGGRFEVFRIGQLSGTIYNYDINSAYPSAMRSLPCLRCGTWEKLTVPALRKLRCDDPDALYLADVRFSHPDQGIGQVCGLPIRHKAGRIYWPREGNGTYWGCEIQAAEKLGAVIIPKGGWRYRAHCEHPSYPWVQQLYDLRKSWGKSLKGYPLKLGLNGAYGKLAQRIGTPKFANPIHASLITAITRTKLMEAAAADPTAIAMFATDGILSVRPLPGLDIGGGLGQWEAKQHDGCFIVQPGIYWGTARKHKTRGISPRFLSPAIPSFEAIWADYAAAAYAKWIGKKWPPRPPRAPVSVELFVGLRLARARRKPDLAGCWIGQRPNDQPREINFDWSGKRQDGNEAWETPLNVHTAAKPGSPTLKSVYHDDVEEDVLAELDMTKLELDDQPDFIEQGGMLD